MSPARRKILPWVALGVIYVVWGSTYMAIRIVVHEMPPLAAAALRFTVAGLLMAIIAAVALRGRERPTARQVIDNSIVGVLLLSAGNGLVMWSETRIPSSIAALIVGTVPLWITLLDGLRPGGQRWTARIWAGTLIGLLGVALIARPRTGLEAGHWGGVIALQGACLCWTLGSLYSQSVVKRLPLLGASAIQMFSGGLALSVMSFVCREDLKAFASASAGAWMALLYLGVFGSLVAFTAFAYCLNELPASTVGTYAYVNPVVAVILGRVFLHEPLPLGLVAGGALVLTAVILTTRPAPRAHVAQASPPPTGLRESSAH